MCPAKFHTLFAQVSKDALIDALWCASQIGTDETTPQITAKAARELIIACNQRGDRPPTELVEAAKVRIDSDGPAD
jgi:uncharacterized protein YceH (UPF0502 family)